jgi:hypothetical protein
MHRDQLRIADPCSADWAAMTGDERERFCAACTKHVHDLSAMTERQAERLVASGGELCVRYAAGADGRVVHARSRLPHLVAMGAALLGAAPALAGTAVAPQPDAEPGLVQRMVTRLQQALDAVLADEVVLTQAEVVMGEIAPAPPPPPPPIVEMGKIAPILPTPAPGQTVIPEVEEALRQQR